MEQCDKAAWYQSGSETLCTSHISVLLFTVVGIHNEEVLS